MALEALNDYLLALRFMLEGGGPADLGPLDAGRGALRRARDSAARPRRSSTERLALERELWSGEPAATRQDAAERRPRRPSRRGPDPGDPCQDAACGHLGTDLRATADEILLADGLAMGEGGAEQRGEDEEWATTPEAEDEPDDELRARRRRRAPPSRSRMERPIPTRRTLRPASQSRSTSSSSRGPRPPPRLADHGALPAPVQVPEPRGRIRMEPRPGPRSRSCSRTPDPDRRAADEHHGGPVAKPRAGRRAPRRAGPEPEPETSTDREPTSDRVAYLFPRPEETEWDVREVSYDRRRRARAS